MEMCYNGALVMPSSYAIMDTDEMTYVDGGICISNFAASLIIDGVVLAIGIGSAALGLKATISALKYISNAAVKTTKKKLISLLRGCLGTVAKAVVGFTIPTALSIASYVCECFMMGSLGGAIAMGLDGLDGRRDGYIRF